MERVFRSLKNEWLPKGGYGDFIHAVRDINQWINGYYNVYRPHTNNDGLPPCLHEEKWKLPPCLHEEKWKQVCLHEEKWKQVIPVS